MHWLAAFPTVNWRLAGKETGFLALWFPVPLSGLGTVPRFLVEKPSRVLTAKFYIAPFWLNSKAGAKFPPAGETSAATGTGSPGAGTDSTYQAIIISYLYLVPRRSSCLWGASLP